MKEVLYLHIRRLVLVAALGTIPGVGWADGAAAKGDAGKFLYAADDDWDWASPLGAEERSKLSMYGEMPWSALDWAEEGIEDVWGVLMGTPPLAGGKLSMDDLNTLRSGRATYSRLEQSDEVLLELLSSSRLPHVIILMQDTGKDGVFGADAEKALVDYVKGGGRLVVLDDWSRYVPLFEKMVEAALALPKPPAGAPLPKAPDVGAEGESEEVFVGRVTDLVIDLRDGDFSKRERATADLKKMGLRAVEVAKELGGDDPEVVARLDRLRRLLDPKSSQKGQPDGKESQNKKHEAAAKRVTESAKKLERAGVSHEVTEVFVDRGGSPLTSLRIRFPVE